MLSFDERCLYDNKKQTNKQTNKIVYSVLTPLASLSLLVLDRVRDTCFFFERTNTMIIIMNNTRKTPPIKTP